MTDEYDSTGTVSRLTGIAKQTLRNWCEANDPRVAGAIRPGREWFIPRRHLQVLKTLAEARQFDPQAAQELREAAGVSATEAARQLGVELHTLRHWERGTFMPSWEQALAYKKLRDRWAAKLRRSTTKSEET